MKKALKHLIFFGVTLIIYQNCGPFRSGDQALLNSLNSDTVIQGDPVLFNKFQTVMENHCVSCHGGVDSQFASIANFAKLQTQSEWIESPSQLIVPGDAISSKVYNRLTFAKGLVPNQNNNMPFSSDGTAITMTEEDANVIKAYIESIEVRGSVLATCEPDYSPGPVELRRLNANEIRNGVRDILSVNDSFSILPEIAAGRFSNIAKFQTVDESFFNYYLEGVEDISVQVSQNMSSQITNCGKNVSCLQGLLNPLAELLFRKQLSAADRETYGKAMQNALGASSNFSAQEIFQGGLQAILLNPQFLYVLREGSGSGERSYNDFELATRLSLTLYSSLPTRSLWQQARDGRLTSDYDGVVNSLLNSSQFSQSFSTRFVEGWLGVSKIDAFSPQTEAYQMSAAEFRPIGDSMKQSVYRTAQYILDNDLSIDSLITGNVRVVDARLAQHLGLSTVPSSGYAAVQLPISSPYAGTGLVTSSPLVSTSLSDRESIVFRGVEVMGAFSCQTPEPPPNNVMAEIEVSDFAEGTPQRVVLQEHSSNAACASCHQSFDPYGFALEAFDGLGRYRTRDQFGNPVDSSGEINGQRFSDHKEMTRLLASEDKFRTCMSQLVLTYSMGKEMDTKNDKADLCTAGLLGAKLKGEKNNIRSIFREAVKSRYFKNWVDQ